MSKHGISIGVERHESNLFIVLTLRGTLTDDDYQVLTPIINNALDGVDERIVDMYVDANELEGFTAHALWDDFKLGLKHAKQFRRIAFVGHSHWQKYAIDIGNWFMAADIQYFEQGDKALHWLNSE